MASGLMNSKQQARGKTTALALSQVHLGNQFQVRFGEPLTRQEQLGNSRAVVLNLVGIFLKS